jgi:four helix bundle protein
MRESILKQKTFDFALKVIRVYKEIIVEHKEYVLSKQFLKAGTAPGALVREAEYGQSKADFISKLSISLKEANECHYWTCLLRDSDFISKPTSLKLLAANEEILKMLTASIKTAKNNLQK